MKSSRASACARRAPFGVESTGLPAKSRGHVSGLRRPFRSHQQCDYRQLAVEFRIVAHARMPTSLVNVAGLAARQHVVCRCRPHCATGFVEIAGDGIEHVDQPLTEPAEGLRGEPDASIGDRAGRSAEGARQRAQRSAAMPVCAQTRSGENPAAMSRNRVRPS